MSQDNVQVATRVFDAHNRRDLDAYMELTAEDYEMLLAVAGAIEAGGIRGRESVRRYFEMLGETWEEFRLVIEEYRDLGDCVLALGRTEGRGRGSGGPVDSSYGAVADVRDGKMWRSRGYLDHGEASRAADLAE